MIVLTQARDPLPDEGDDAIASTRAAIDAGFTPVHLPPEADHSGDLLAPLRALARRDRPETAVWVGTIPEPHVYRAVDEALRARAISLINDTEQHLLAFEFDRAYPHLADLTPRTMIVTSPDEAEAAAAVVGLPAFVKGAVLSRKHMGWRHCVASTVPELAERISALLRSPYHARGRVLVRALARLRHHTVAATDVPVAREYRVFCHRGEPLGHGYYWPFWHEFVRLLPAEEDAVLALAREAARRLTTPWLSLDIGQLVDGTWIVIETGDPQFSGLSFIAPRPVYLRLAARLLAEGSA